MLLYKHNKDKLELQWESGYRIVALPTKWTARIKNKETGEPKGVNVRDLKLKDPAEDWQLKAEDIGRGEKFVNGPSNLPDIDWVSENDISNSPDKDQEKLGPLVIGSFGIMKSNGFHDNPVISCEIWP